MRVDANYHHSDRDREINFNWHLPNLLTQHLYEPWLDLDVKEIAERGMNPDATEEEVIAALALSTLRTNQVEASARPKARRLPEIRMAAVRDVLINHFDCEWGQAVGSEQKVYRPGYKFFRFGKHLKNPSISPNTLQRCLKRLEITAQDFLDAAYRNLRFNHSI